MTALILSLVLMLLPGGQAAEASTFDVTNTNDSGAGSLRQAILNANTNPGLDYVEFHIPITDKDCDAISGVCVIAPLTELPTLTGGNTVINGFTQPGASPPSDKVPAQIKIALDGFNLGASSAGFRITSNENVIGGIAICHFVVGILISNGDDNVVCGNHIGVDASGGGTGGYYNGVQIEGDSQRNQVGDGTYACRNVISNNQVNGVVVQQSGATDNVIAGNYIGTDVQGQARLHNGFHGVVFSGSYRNVVGGDTAAERNVISGNEARGIMILEGGEHTVSGNYIGTNHSGAVALHNVDGGIYIDHSAGNTIGGDTPGERNVISGNWDDGIEIGGETATDNVVSGNYIGTNAAGTSALANAWQGVWLSAPSNTIGGDTTGERNIISGNGSHGIVISGLGATSNTISGNYVGTDYNGVLAVPNTQQGISIDNSAGNTIGGDTAGERNVISGNGGYGIYIYGPGAIGNTISGNYIGIDASGAFTLPNVYDGIYIESSPSNTIGGDIPGERNVISGNGDEGIFIYGAESTGNTISGNYIGADASGTVALGNNEGVGLYAASTNTIGPDNLIAHNDYDGVRLQDSSALGNVITRNRIWDNDEGIELLDGANGAILPPVIQSTASSGSVHVMGTACPGCVVEVFANSDDDGEGETYVGQGTADLTGAFTVTLSELSQPYLTATATDAISGTSKFSAVFLSSVLELKYYFPVLMKSY